MAINDFEDSNKAKYSNLETKLSKLLKRRISTSFKLIYQVVINGKIRHIVFKINMYRQTLTKILMISST